MSKQCHKINKLTNTSSFCILFTSIIGIVLLGQIASSATTSNRASGVIRTGDIGQDATKAKGRPVMHAAFQNAGKHAGTEVWRIEVSH